MSPNAKMFRSGTGGLVPEFGIADYFGNRFAEPKLMEVVSGTDQHLATAYDETSDTRSSRNGAAGAKVTLADDVITYGEMEAK